MRKVLIFPFLIFLMINIAVAQDLEFVLQNGSENEVKTREQLKKILKQYDLSKWIFTKKIIIDEKSIPHSHPVLTLHTRHLDNDLQLLSTFIHEQIHWFEEERKEQKAAAIKELQAAYPEAPDKLPEGSRDKYSTYLHLIVCYSEYEAMKELVGEKQATEVMQSWTHYKWIYRTILTDHKKIRSIIEKNNLKI
jgi:hypothetical protein